MTDRGDSLQSWFQSVPLITKVFLVSTLASGAALSFRLLDASALVLIWGAVRDKFQFWRLFTCFIYAGPFSFNFALHAYVLYDNCRRYELNPFNTGAGGNTADFLWMLMISMGILLLVSCIFEMYVLSEPILYVIMYVWSRREPDAMLNIYGFRFKALYLPWVYVAIRMIMGGAITEPLMGIAVGHLYYFLVEVFPVSHRVNLIKTPRFCTDIVHYCTGLTPGNNAGYTAVPPVAARAVPVGAAGGTGDGLRYRGAADRNARTGGYNWGSGRVLGNN
jgi:Derlin-2/3